MQHGGGRHSADAEDQSAEWWFAYPWSYAKPMPHPHPHIVWINKSVRFSKTDRFYGANNSYDLTNFQTE